MESQDTRSPWAAPDAAQIKSDSASDYVAHLCLGDFPADTSWHHVAVVASGSGVTSYVDGGNIGGDPDASNLVSAPGATLYVGTYDPADGFLAAQIDEVRVFARALSPADIAELCTCRSRIGDVDA